MEVYHGQHETQKPHEREDAGVAAIRGGDNGEQD